jgi:cholesterol transport system auxiliary component
MAPRWLVLAIALSGCTLLPPQPAPPVVYDFGSASPATVPTGLPAALQVQAPPWLDGTALVYRLEYTDGARLASYRDSRWAAAPSALLGEQLRQRLARSGAQRALLLRVDIEEFCQVFSTPTRSRGVVRLRATLADSASGRVLKQQAFAHELDAATPDAAGGAHALAQAAAELSVQVLSWSAEPA